MFFVFLVVVALTAWAMLRSKRRKTLAGLNPEHPQHVRTVAPDPGNGGLPLRPSHGDGNL